MNNARLRVAIVVEAVFTVLLVTLAELLIRLLVTLVAPTTSSSKNANAELETVASNAAETVS
jgi:hypothetical protein